VSGYGRVVVGTSGSPGSIPALRSAGDIARREDVPLVAIHAWLPPGGDLAERRAPSAYLRKMWAEAASERLTESLETAWGCIPPWLQIQCVVVRGAAGPVLVELANSSADLLVIGAGRRGCLRRIGHAEVSRYCLARASCPVLAVPPAAAMPARGHGPGHHDRSIEEALRAWQREKIDRERP
jgi:nucleotide-binding universal stress UspA family protein